MKSIATLITVHNRRNKTLQCHKELFGQKIQEGFELDVFLVDDGSTDGTYKAVASEYPKVNIIKGNGQLFWNRGMHLAWESAAKVKDYDYYLWLNDDTTLNYNAINTLLDTSTKKHDTAIIIGSTSSEEDDEKITYGGLTFPNGLVTPKKEPTDCDFFNGNIVLLPKAVYKKVGTNDPVFRHALGDFDYGLRAGKMGIQLIVAPGILGKCDNHKVLPTWCNPEKTFKQRWNAFRSPLGQHPEEFFIFKNRHSGIFSACYYYLLNHTRVLFPQLWNLKN